MSVFEDICGGHGHCDYSEALFLCIKRVTSRTWVSLIFFWKLLIQLFRISFAHFSRILVCPIFSSSHGNEIADLIFESEQFICSLMKWICLAQIISIVSPLVKMPMIFAIMTQSFRFIHLLLKTIHSYSIFWYCFQLTFYDSPVLIAKFLKFFFDFIPGTIGPRCWKEFWKY